MDDLFIFLTFTTGFCSGVILTIIFIFKDFNDMDL